MAALNSLHFPYDTRTKATYKRVEYTSRTAKAITKPLKTHVANPLEKVGHAMNGDAGGINIGRTADKYA